MKTPLATVWKGDTSCWLLARRQRQCEYFYSCQIARSLCTNYATTHSGLMATSSMSLYCFHFFIVPCLPFHLNLRKQLSALKRPDLIQVSSNQAVFTALHFETLLRFLRDVATLLLNINITYKYFDFASTTIRIPVVFVCTRQVIPLMYNVFRLKAKVPVC